MTTEPAFRDTRFTRRYTIVIRILMAALMTPVLFVLAGLNECVTTWRNHAPGLVREWRQ
jgi:hypothetical protein